MNCFVRGCLRSNEGSDTRGGGGLSVPRGPGRVGSRRAGGRGGRGRMAGRLGCLGLTGLGGWGSVFRKLRQGGCYAVHIPRYSVPRYHIIYCGPVLNSATNMNSLTRIFSLRKLRYMNKNLIFFHPKTFPFRFCVNCQYSSR